MVAELLIVSVGVYPPWQTLTGHVEVVQGTFNSLRPLIYSPTRLRDQWTRVPVLNGMKIRAECNG